MKAFDSRTIFDLTLEQILTRYLRRLVPVLVVLGLPLLAVKLLTDNRLPDVAIIGILLFSFSVFLYYLSYKKTSLPHRTYYKLGLVSGVISILLGIIFGILETPGYLQKDVIIIKPPSSSKSLPLMNRPSQADTTTSVAKAYKVFIIVPFELAGAHIFVDDKFAGVAPAELELTEGSHHLKVVSKQMEGVFTYERIIFVPRNERIDLSRHEFEFHRQDN